MSSVAHMSVFEKGQQAFMHAPFRLDDRCISILVDPGMLSVFLSFRRTLVLTCRMTAASSMVFPVSMKALRT